MKLQRGNPSAIISTEYMEVIPAQRSTGKHLLPRRTSAVMGKVMEEAMVLSTHDRCLALLAKAGMEHTAALSLVEQQFSSITPQGRERYREIVDAYAQQAADKVRRWGNARVYHDCYVCHCHYR